MIEKVILENDAEQKRPVTNIGRKRMQEPMVVETRISGGSQYWTSAFRQSNSTDQRTSIKTE